MESLPNQELRGPLDDALADEIRSLDIILTRVWELLSAAGIVGGLGVWLFWGLPVGAAMAGLSAFGLPWFALQARWLKGPRAPLAIWMGASMEATLPGISLVIVARSEGAAYALGSYVTPMLFTCLIVASAARLRPMTTLLFGFSTGVSFIALYFFWLRGELSPAFASMPLYSPILQVMRGLSFAGGGALASIIARGLRHAIGRAERHVRSHDLFGKYRLGERIGAGGMGVVHRALYCPEGGFERTVAVKMLHSHLADKPSFMAEFRQEAELSARLAHPNIVQVLDFGRVGAAYFLAMDYVDGTTLFALERAFFSKNKQLSPDFVAWIGREIAAGLVHSHTGARDAEGRLLRVVHRDLCPANILVSASGEVKISDFGVAKALRDASASETKTVAGHIGYMAPEQARAESIDERCDLFALAIILWELVSGRRLFFRGTEGPSLLALFAGEVTPVSSIREDVGPEWDRFFERGLAPSPSNRFASAAEMSAELLTLRRENGSCADELAELVQWAAENDVEIQAGLPAKIDRTADTLVDRELSL